MLELATEVFVQGFGYTRSFTHPYVAVRIGKVWLVRDAPRKNPIDYRREEWIALDASPAEVDQLARRRTRGRFAVCAMIAAGEDDRELRAEYKRLGYRLQASEPVMAHRLKKLSRVESPATIERIVDQATADALTAVAERRQILPEHLSPDSRLRAYVAKVDGQIVGWVRSIECEAGTWCSNMFVLPKHRRRGIASALLVRMLRDDRVRGAKLAILTASHAGAKLYGTVGYEQVGTLLLFNPRRK